MQSRLISKKQDVEHELKLDVGDLKRKRYLLARLSQAERDISVMGFSADDIEKSDSSYAGANNKVAVSKQY